MIKFIPSNSRDSFGYLRVGGENCEIKSWHTWDDYGYEIEVAEIEHDNGELETIYSDDNGETWRRDIN